MKLKDYIFILPFLILTLVGCKDDDSPAFTSENSFSLILPYDINEGVTLTFNASDDWTIYDAGNSRLTFSKTSGTAGVNEILIKAKEYNNTNDKIRYSFTITSSHGGRNKNVDVELLHEPVFMIKDLNYDVGPDGGTLHILVKSNEYLSRGPLRVYSRKSDFDDMIAAWKSKEQSEFADGKMTSLDTKITRSEVSDNEEILTITIKPNTTSRVLKGIFYICVDDNFNVRSELLTVVQPAANTYCSRDLETGDSIVTQLQKHKLGNGVPIVILGDGFLDKDITGGKFREATDKAMDALFSMHPMKALRDYFDVYEVTAVSYNDFFSPHSYTAFNSKFTSAGSSEIRGNDEKAKEYAKLAVGKERINDATVIVLVNENQYGGTTNLFADEIKFSNIPNGCSIAYIPLYESDGTQLDFSIILNHEAVGHGFAKLADEYDTGRLGMIPDTTKLKYEKVQMYGGCRNIAFNSDVTKSYWANFAADSQYASEHLGCYEGAVSHAMGIYRPTEESIMNKGLGGFNVIGRALIYKRCMHLAFGDKWKYKEADFIAFDLEHNKEASSKRNAPAKRSGTFQPLAPPRITIMNTAK